MGVPSGASLVSFVKKNQMKAFYYSLCDVICSLSESIYFRVHFFLRECYIPQETILKSNLSKQNPIFHVNPILATYTSLGLDELNRYSLCTPLMPVMSFVLRRGRTECLLADGVYDAMRQPDATISPPPPPPPYGIDVLNF